MSDRDTGGGFAAGFLIGAVVGVAVGFLYAPKTGRETRALLKEKTEEVRGKAGEVTEKAKDVAEKARGVATEAKKRVEDKLGHKETA